MMFRRSSYPDDVQTCSDLFRHFEAKNMLRLHEAPEVQAEPLEVAVNEGCDATKDVAGVVTGWEFR